MSCQTDIPIRDIADIVGENFIPKEGGKGKETTLVDPRIRGDVALDRDAKEALCEALSPCIDDALTPLETEIGEVDKKADDAVSAAQSANNAADNAMGEAQAAGEAANSAIEAAQSAQQTALNKAVVRVIATGDKREIVLGNGAKIPFYITDKSVPVEPMYNDEKVVGFGVKGDNIVITMIDGTEHDLTRQEFADWLSSQDSTLATDSELADAIANGTGDLQDQVNAINNNLDSLQAQIDAFDADQAMLFVRGDKLVLRNEDNTEHEVPLVDLLPLSPDSGNLLEKRNNGIYYGVQAPPNLANLYIDGEFGSDGVSVEDGGGTIDKPFKTLQHALDITPSDKTNTIHLKATDSTGAVQTYHVERDYRVEDGAIRNYRAYAQPIVNKDLINCWRSSGVTDIYPHASEQWVTPIIRHGTRKAYNNTTQLLARAFLSGNGTIIYLGVALALPDVDFDTTEFRPIGRYLHTGTGKVGMRNVNLIDEGVAGTNLILVTQGQETSFTAKGVKMVTDRELNGTDFRRLIDISGGILSMSVADFPNNPAGTGQIESCGVEVTRRTGNMIPLLKSSGTVTGIVRHDTGVPLNLSSNINI